MDRFQWRAAHSCGGFGGGIGGKLRKSRSTLSNSCLLSVLAGLAFHGAQASKQSRLPTLAFSRHFSETAATGPSI